MRQVAALPQRQRKCRKDARAAGIGGKPGEQRLRFDQPVGQRFELVERKIKESVLLEELAVPGQEYADKKVRLPAERGSRGLCY